MLGQGTVTAAALAVLLLAGPSLAGADEAKRQVQADATLYELTENMTFNGATQLRTATAALQGTARVGTPLCPALLIHQLVAFGLLPAPAPCTVTAIGSDEVNAATGAGTLSGTFAVVVQGDNPVDAPEFVVMTGSFSGTMQALVDASFRPLPLIAITSGVFTPEQVLAYPAAAFGFGPAKFGGTFRLPFALGANGEKEKVRRHQAAFYLGDDGRPVRVQRDELSLGWPTVRVEISFE